MTLDQWLKSSKVTEAAFAERIGSTQASVNRYRSGRIPEAKAMRAIFQATEGQVTADDFFAFKRDAA